MQVLTSLSGLQFSAASAGFAPTNSADVSAIASSYQVVSSTSTQLHAGTAYLTGVNGAPISASRAGQAANASLSNSAYYDGTGRLISALPDSAAVSAIASSYAESVASGKQDTIEFGYDDGKISSIDGSALAGQGGGGGLVTSIQSALDPWFRTGISGLNGSALYPKWAESAQSAGYATDAASASTAHYAQSAPTAWASSFITGVESPSGTIRVQGGTAIECTNSALLPSTVIEGFSIEEVIGNTTNTTSFTVPVSNPTTRLHFGDAYGAPGLFAIDTDNGLHYESSIESYFDVTFDLPNATSFTATYPWVANLHYTASASYEEEGGGVAELAWASALPTYEYDGDGKISAIDGSALAGGGGGGGGGGVVTSVSSYSGYTTSVNDSALMAVPSAHMHYQYSGYTYKGNSATYSITVAPYINSSFVYTPPVGCNSVYYGGIPNANVSASSMLRDGTVVISNQTNNYCITASADISATRFIWSGTSNQYYYRTASASGGVYHPAGDAIIPLVSVSDMQASAVMKTDTQLALNGAFAEPNCLAIGTGANAYGASVAIGEANNTAFSESIAIGYANSAYIYGFAGGASNTATGSAMAHGYGNHASGQSLSVGAHNSSQSASVALGAFNTADTTSVAMGSANTASQASLVQGIQNSAYWNSLAVGSSLMAGSRSLAVGASSTADKTAFAQGRACYASGNSFAQGSFNSATDYSFAQGYGLLAENTATVFGTYNQSSNGAGTTGAAFVIGDGTASDSLHDLMVVTKDGEITMFSGTADTVGTGIMSSIRAISAAATGGGGGVDSATVSAIASAYVESGVSSKLDSSASSSFYTTANESGFVDSAYVDSAFSGKMDSSASSSFYTTANESGFVDSAYVESSVSGKQDASAMSAYALSSDVSGTVDLVSSQSANWGGSALQLSAGPGVTFTKSGNVLVAGLDETVLWSGEGISAGQSTSLSESITAFERIRVYGHTHNGKAFSWTNEQEALSSQIYGVGLSVWQGSNQELDFSRYSVSGSSISALSGSFIANLNPVGMGNSISWVYKVVGINRTAEA